ncbi:MAG: hypothetical protein RIR79_207 [Pseudomonadota bacterium]|jgi:hypothetical protein
MRNKFFKLTTITTTLAAALGAGSACATNDGFFQDGATPNSERAEAVRAGESDATRARISSAPKAPAVKTVTNFTQALRCMDELFLANGKKNIVITSAGIPDATGKARAGDKEMLISAISKMSLRSNAFEFIDLTAGTIGTADSDLGTLFALRKDKNTDSTKVPDFYIRGAVTQLDDNAVRESKGAGFAFPWFDFSYSKDKSFDLISMDISVVDAATRRILPETNTSNTMVITKEGRSGELGGQIFTLGLSFSKDISRSEGVGATYRTLIELGLIESLGKFTRVPYWKCLDIESTNPQLLDQVREWYDVATNAERILFIQRKLAGMSRYTGDLDGEMSDDLKKAILEYQASTGLIADGRVNFDLYFHLKDDIQNQLAALPTTPAKKVVTLPTSSLPVASDSASFRIILSSERGDTPVYKVGEFLNMRMSLNQQGTAYCFYEDAKKNTVRIFPNRFHRDSMLNGGQPVPLGTGGFKIKFDSAGRERVACIASDRALIAPASLSEAQDLNLLPFKSLEQIIEQFKKINPVMTNSIVDIKVQ